MIAVLVSILIFLSVIIVLMNMFQQSVKPTVFVQRPTRQVNWWNGWNRWNSWQPQPPRTAPPSTGQPECRRDSDCGSGLVCAGGVCRSGGGGGGGGGGAHACSNNQDCGYAMDCKMIGNRRQCVQSGEASIM